VATFDRSHAVAVLVSCKQCLSLGRSESLNLLCYAYGYLTGPSLPVVHFQRCRSLTVLKQLNVDLFRYRYEMLKWPLLEGRRK